MRRFPVFLCAALMFVAMFFAASRVDGRDDPKEKQAPKYWCAVCDNEAYQPTENSALVFIHITGLGGEYEHRVPHFETGSATGFVFKEDAKSPARICTAWHVLRILEHWEGSVVLFYFRNAKEPVPVRLTYANVTKDIAILDFADPNYEYEGEAFELGDDGDLAKGDEVVAIGAPNWHPFMKSSGKFRGYYNSEGGAIRIRHDAAAMGGSSGGPLLDENGRVVGINVAVLTKESALYPGTLAARVSDLKAMLKQERREQEEEKEKMDLDGE